MGWAGENVGDPGFQNGTSRGGGVVSGSGATGQFFEIWKSSHFVPFCAVDGLAGKNADTSEVESCKCLIVREQKNHIRVFVCILSEFWRAAVSTRRDKEAKQKVPVCPSPCPLPRGEGIAIERVLQIRVSRDYPQVFMHWKCSFSLAWEK